MAPIGDRLECWKRKLSDGFGQVKQLASETTGSSDTLVTERPDEFIYLSRKCEKMNSFFTSLFTFVQQLIETHKYKKDSTKSKFRNIIKSLSSDSSSTPSSSSDSNNEKKINEVGVQIFQQGIDALGDGSNDDDDNDEARNTNVDLLRGLQLIHERMLLEEDKFERDLKWKFLEPFSSFKELYKAIHRSQVKVERSKLKLDSLRNSTNKAGIEDRKSAFEEDVEASISAMKEFISFSETSHCLHALIMIQQEFYESNAKIWKDLKDE